MNKTTIIYAFILSVFFISSCNKKVYIPQTKTEYIEKEILRDTIIYIEVPKEIQRTVDADSSTLENLYSISKASVDSAGLLHHSLEQKEQSVPINIVYKDKIITQRDTISIVKEVKGDTKIKYRVPAWCWFIISVITIIGGYKLVKIFKL